MSDRLLVTQEQGQNAIFGLVGPMMTIGRDHDCDISLDDSGIAGKHAALEKTAGTWVLHALAPKSPILSDGQPVNSLRLENGTTFTLGHLTLRFVAKLPTIALNQDTPSSKGKDQDQAIAQVTQAREKIINEIGKVIIGQRQVLEEIIVALFARGHCLLLGVPGLAKTMMVKALAATLDLQCRRIQFTPDLMPADITGTNILQEDRASGRREFRFSPGPIFANILLADEINRTPPKTQAALLEAMQEQKITAAGASHDLPQPFMVLATQNPIEQEGTYPLPEAQLDRFMFCIHVDYPSVEEEQEILLATTRDLPWQLQIILDNKTIVAFQHLVRQVPVSKHVAAYATSLIRATRPGNKESPEFINRWLRWGAGPRAGQYLLLAAKSYALLHGRANVSCKDIARFALPVLRHRIFCNFVAASEGAQADAIVAKILEQLKPPKY